jgi:hypothetical protein
LRAFPQQSGSNHYIEVHQANERRSIDTVRSEIGDRTIGRLFAQNPHAALPRKHYIGEKGSQAGIGHSGCGMDRKHDR